MNIKDYGFDSYFEALAAEYPALTPARVTVQEKDLYRIVSNDGERSASVSERFRYEAKVVSEYPAVGDFVMVDHTDDEKNAVIHAVLPRKSVFTRRAAGTANGELSEERYRSYTKLTTENAYAEDSESYLALKEKKFKEIAKYNKNNKKR